VLYVTMEGKRRFPDRIVGIRERYQWDSVWFAFSTVSIDLRTTGADADRIIATAKAMMAECGVARCIIVGDTFTRMLGGGSDSKPEDVGPVLANVGRILDALPNTHVILVHHSGKDQSRGARGWSGLPCAVDAEFNITRDGEVRALTVTKERDSTDGDSFPFQLRQVEIGTYDDGAPITTCVVDYLDAVASRRRLTGKPKLAYDQLARAIADQGQPVPTSSHTPGGALGVKLETWQDYCDRAALSTSDKTDSRRKAFDRAFTMLRGAKIIGTWTGWVWIESAPTQ
jgi:AAA domain